MTYHINQTTTHYFEQRQKSDWDGVGPDWVLDIKEVDPTTLHTLQKSYTFVRMAGDFPVYARNKQ